MKNPNFIPPSFYISQLRILHALYMQNLHLIINRLLGK